MKSISEQSQNQREIIITSNNIPLERIHNIRRDIKNYQDKWGDEKKVSGLLDSPATEKIYNLFQYLNRGASAIGGSLLLVGRGDFDNQYTQVGGITTLISVYIEFFSSIAKEKLFNVEERKKELDDLKKDTENLCSSYWELKEIFRICSNNLGRQLDLNEEHDQREKNLISSKLGLLTFLKSDFVNKAAQISFGRCMALSAEFLCCVTCCPCYTPLRLWCCYASVGLVITTQEEGCLDCCFFCPKRNKIIEDWENEWKQETEKRKKIMESIKNFLENPQKWLDRKEQKTYERKEMIIDIGSEQYELQILVCPK